VQFGARLMEGAGLAQIGRGLAEIAHDDPLASLDN
jgi:hypothetical protein